MKYMIYYLLSFSDPKVSTVLVIERDSIFFYHNSIYQKKMIVHKTPTVYVFEDAGFVYIRKNKVVVEYRNKTEFHRILRQRLVE